MTRLFATLTAVLFLAVVPMAAAQETKMTRTMTISGQGEVRVVPDMAAVTIGVMSSAATAQDALISNTKTMGELIALVKASGIEARDVTTSNFMVNPRYDYGASGTQPPKIVGYDVSNAVVVIVRKLETLGSLLDKSVSSGSNQINGVSFMVSEPDAALDEARTLAVAEARRKAEIYAAAAGVTLGDLIAMTEGNNAMPFPVNYAKSARSETADAVPIAQGEQSLTADVSITFEIK